MSFPLLCDGGAPMERHHFYPGSAGCFFCGLAKPLDVQHDEGAPAGQPEQDEPADVPEVIECPAR